jgi:hypothetical protein
MGWVWPGNERWHNGANGRMYAVGEFNRVEGWAIGTATNIGGQVGVAIVDAVRQALKSVTASL